MKPKKISPVNQSKTEILRRIGARLTKKRKDLGYTNSDHFAYDKGINRSQYGKYEAGSQDIRIGTLARIVNLMGLTLDEFFKND